MNLAINSIVVFAVAGMVDAVWTQYIQTAAQGKPLAAAVWSALTILCGSFVTVEYIANKWMIIPAVLGGFIGTYLMMKFNNKKVDN
jgi:membrane protein DedA with SNARE-associated domain